jgi:hypothetical protein
MPSVCNFTFLHTARLRTSSPVCRLGFLHTARLRTSSPVCRLGLLHTVWLRTSGPVCRLGLLHTVWLRTSSPVCRLGFLHTVRRAESRRGGCGEKRTGWLRWKVYVVTGGGVRGGMGHLQLNFSTNLPSFVYGSHLPGFSPYFGTGSSPWSDSSDGFSPFGSPYFAKLVQESTILALNS